MSTQPRLATLCRGCKAIGRGMNAGSIDERGGGGRGGGVEGGGGGHEEEKEEIEGQKKERDGVGRSRRANSVLSW